MSRLIGLLSIVFIFLVASTIAVELNANIVWFNAACFWFSNVFVPFLTNMLATLAVLLFGYNQIVKDLEQRERRRELGKVTDFWRFPGHCTGCVIVYGGDPPTFKDDEVMKSSEATIYSIVKLEEALKKVHGDRFPIDERPASALIDGWGSLREANVIILGGYLSIPKMEDVQEKLALPFKQDFSNKDERQVTRKKGKKGTESYVSPCKQIDCDFAMVTRIFDKSRQRTIFWFSGNYGIGTFASVLYFTSPEFLSQVVSVDGTQSTQFIVRVTEVVDNRIRSSHRAIEVLQEESFDLDSNDITSVVFG